MSVQCYLPRLAFDALDVPAIIAVARIAGVERPRIESSTHKIPDSQPAGSIRITTSLDMALCLVEAFAQRAGKAETEQNGALIVACAKAVKSLFDAIDETRKAPQSRGFGPNS